jgi:signal transduction histidine kinase
MPPSRASRARAARPRRPTTKNELAFDLSVHQEELRAQNAKLIEAMSSVEEARDRFIELYDFAPNGYVTLDARGFVREINLSAVAMLGGEREKLVGLPILRFIPSSQRLPFLKWLNVCRLYRDGAWPVLEIPLETVRGVRIVRLTGRPRSSGGDRAQLLLTTMVDVTDQRHLEAEREEARLHHAELVRRTLSAVEHERQRIARDIHDDVGQQITALRMKLDWFVSLVRDNEGLSGPLKTVQAAVAGVDRHIDFLLRELRPAGLDDLGLVSALTQAIREWSETFGVRAEFRSSGLDGQRLPSPIETHAYRIVQEALNNVHKHAAARNVLVRLERRGLETVLTVTDDGVGFDADMSARHDGRRGLGLLGMRERAALIGGELHLTSKRGRGTTVVVVFH